MSILYSDVLSPEKDTSHGLPPRSAAAEARARCPRCNASNFPKATIGTSTSCLLDVPNGRRHPSNVHSCSQYIKGEAIALQEDLPERRCLRLGAPRTNAWHGNLALLLIEYIKEDLIHGTCGREEFPSEFALLRTAGSKSTSTLHSNRMTLI